MHNYWKIQGVQKNVIIPFSNLLEKSLTINILLSNMNQKFSISTKLSKIFSFLLTFFMEKFKITNLNQNFVSIKTVPKFSKTIPLPCLRHESNIYTPELFRMSESFNNTYWMYHCTVGIWGSEMAKKVFKGFDSIFHVYLIRGLQKYQINWIPTVAFWATT